MRAGHRRTRTTNTGWCCCCRHLDLSYNELRNFNDLKPLTQLEELYLPRNKIPSMEETLLGMTELRMLEMGSNRLKVSI